jgi:predicted ABC-type ATPase
MCTREVGKDDYRKYRDALFSSARPVFPTIIVMVGGPGSGKESARKQCLKSLKYNEADFVVIDPDTILAAMFNNNNACYGMGFSGKPSIALDVAGMNNLNFEYALENRYNIVFDGTGRNIRFTRDHVILRAKQLGYRTVLCISVVDARTALLRTQRRSDTSGRKVDAGYLKEVYQTLADTIPAYIATPKQSVDILQVYDNLSKMDLVLERVGDEISCLSSQRRQRTMCTKLSDKSRIYELLVAEQ